MITTMFTKTVSIVHRVDIVLDYLLRNVETYIIYFTYTVHKQSKH